MFVTQLIRCSAWKSADPRRRIAGTTPIIAKLDGGSLLVALTGQSTTAGDSRRARMFPNGMTR
jgi:hypothetical protein